MNLYYYDHLNFGIYEGEFKNKELNELSRLGNAILLDNNRYYTLRFKNIPGKTFYLIRNNKRLGKYLIFEKKIGNFKFDKLVGRATLQNHLKEHMEITMLKHGFRAYMSLLPENAHQNTNKGNY